MKNKDIIDELNIKIIELEQELKWWQDYGLYVNIYYYNADCNASEYADQENQF
jgi:hypothetical protein